MALKVGIVGWGDIALVHAKHIRSAGAEVSAVVSRKNKLEIDAPVYQSIDDMLPHVDAVSVAVPNFLHASTCLKAVRAGKAVMVEKPICISHEELDDLERTVSLQKLTVHVGYRLRWNPTVMKLKERIKGIRKISCMYNLPMQDLDENKGWTTRSSESGGGFFTLGVHSLDLARWLTGARGEVLTGITAQAEGIEQHCDFPLHVRLSGTLPSGIEITAGTDLRSETHNSFDITIEAEEGSYPDNILPPPNPEEETIEYETLFRNFIQAAEQNIWDKDEWNEIAQTHRELLTAREIASSASGV